MIIIYLDDEVKFPCACATEKSCASTVARVFTLACADEHLLRNLESLVAVQLNKNKLESKSKSKLS